MQATQTKRKDGQAEVCLGFTTTGWKPEQITDVAVGAGRICNSGNIEQDKSELKWVPGKSLAISCPLRLQGNCTIGKAECKTNIFVLDQQVYTFTHTPGCIPAI